MTKTTEEQRQRMCELREQGLPMRRIAEIVGTTYETVNYHCTRLGAEPPNPRPLPEGIVGPAVMQRGDHVVRRFTPEEDEQILSLLATGAEVPFIAEILNRRPHSIRGRLNTLARRELRRETLAELGIEMEGDQR